MQEAAIPSRRHVRAHRDIVHHCHVDLAAAKTKPPRRTVPAFRRAVDGERSTSPRGAAAGTSAVRPDSSLLFPAPATTVPCSGNTISLPMSPGNSPASFSNHCRVYVRPAPNGADSCEIP